MASSLRVCEFLALCYRHILNVRFLFFVICFGFIASIIWIELVNIQEKRHQQYLALEALHNVEIDYRYAETYKKKENQSKNLKFILIWTQDDLEPTLNSLEGQRILIERNCSVVNCYFTKNRSFFVDGLQNFDAIAFNGRALPKSLDDVPAKRWPHQKYVYMNMESSANYPVCSKIFNGFFNMTATYKLNSDVPYRYMIIKNSEGDIVGPKQVMTWINYSFNESNNTFISNNKSKAAAWFVSNCNDKSHRLKFANELSNELYKYGYFVDIYGKCGKLSCPKEKQAECNNRIDQEYYFYLSLENSFAQDYVTEKLLTALRNNAVPIVFGGANYSRFLPPYSFINGRKYSPENLAKILVELISDPVQYRQYFWWKYYYSYQDSGKQNLCDLCAKLNDESFMKRKTMYENFREWWNPNYCK